MKQARAGRMVSEDDIPPPVAASTASNHRPADVASRQAPAAAPSIEIPRPTVISTAPVPKPRTSVSQTATDQQPVVAGGPGINVAKSAVNAPPVQLHTAPASHRPAGSGNLIMFDVCSNIR